MACRETPDFSDKDLTEKPRFTRSSLKTPAKAKQYGSVWWSFITQH
jgi:hypothetical protein